MQQSFTIQLFFFLLQVIYQRLLFFIPQNNLFYFSKLLFFLPQNNLF
ncbi:unnamed protein product [Arabidopsis halleri]